VSLLWVLVVAILRTTKVDGIVTNLIAAALLIGAVAVLITLRSRRIHRSIPPPPPPAEGSFPVPPLPTPEVARA